jgi:hypothetical protein
MNRYTHRVIRVKTGNLCSEHTTKELAEKMVARLVAMSGGKLTRADFRIEPIA